MQRGGTATRSGASLGRFFNYSKLAMTNLRSLIYFVHEFLICLIRTIPADI